MASLPHLLFISPKPRPNPRAPVLFSFSSPKPLPRSPPAPTRSLATSASPSPFPSLELTPSPNARFPWTSTANGFDLEPYLGCFMPGRRLKVAVLLSGGVDSSVALRLLHAAGHSCTAFYLKIWFQEDFENFWSECPWDEDLKYAKSCFFFVMQVGVPLEVVHLSDEYWNNVVSHIISEYRCGRTPNPDVLCNTRIKFGAFLKAIENMEFDYIASGHYAHVYHSSFDKRDEPSVLALSKDMVKDQTYFLSHLSQFQLRRLLFPLGCIPKVRHRVRLAALMDLPNKDRKDSQGICFLGKVKFSEFVARHIGEMEGVLLEAESGDYLGKHRGFWFYTIGQRQGLRLPGGPWYVVEKDVQNNVRHGPGFYDCSITLEPSDLDSEEDVTAVVHLSDDDQGLASGQFTAFYRDEICIGSGVILDSWDNKSFPVCAKALEIARMEDKSKLGKPVKITNQDINIQHTDNSSAQM
ncbi:hypothetical protein J5N97_000856 [Dioscorea zingiberensis]|uniref:tRNA-5-taurinomethyluridine 2-sulfurtransferase n=1 Tax=Dioscorea zingiberensis TaxID=325984 RepID=A0A9D5H2T3_9LILI|nr:hypothetical protein J5N97_000856 [Dioscorea zingiberensis]